MAFFAPAPPPPTSPPPLLPSPCHSTATPGGRSAFGGGRRWQALGGGAPSAAVVVVVCVRLNREFFIASRRRRRFAGSLDVPRPAREFSQEISHAARERARPGNRAANSYIDDLRKEDASADGFVLAGALRNNYLKNR